MASDFGLSFLTPRRSYVLLFLWLFSITDVVARGVTTGTITGQITDLNSQPLSEASIFVLHLPSGTLYKTSTTSNGLYVITGMRVGGPYTVAVLHKDFRAKRTRNKHITLGDALRLDFQLTNRDVSENAEEVSIETHNILNSERRGTATLLTEEQTDLFPSIQRSSQDLFRLDPRGDGNFSFSGRNWQFNSISLDGAYFNNSFGLDNPVVGGQSNANAFPLDALEQIYISLAPFDVRESGFTGANLNAITKSGSNRFRGSVYSYTRNESLRGDDVRGTTVLNRNLGMNLTGFTASGPLRRKTLYFFINGEIESQEVPGSDFVASRPGLGGEYVSRVDAATMEAIRQRMNDVYLYDPGPYEGYRHETSNRKLALKLDWNLDDQNTLMARYNLLDAKRELPPDPFSITINDVGRGPSPYSLPFRNAGFAMNNELHSFAFELNSHYANYENSLFVSYGRVRDFRTPFSRPFPTIEIASGDTTYTTLGHEPFSINNRVAQNVWQVADNVTLARGRHIMTLGASLERFNFENSFNLFQYGNFFLPAQVGGTRFNSIAEFFALTNPDSAGFRDFNAEVNQQQLAPVQTDRLRASQIAVYFQDNYSVSDRLDITAGLRVDFPFYNADLPGNAFSQTLTLLDQNRNLERIDAGELPGVKALFSPRFGFNWNVTGDRATQVRGGTGLFAGRLPFVWVSNVLANQGPNSALPSLNINAVDSDFKWPQIWSTNFAVDQRLPWRTLGTFEMLYGKDVNAAFVRNADLVTPAQFLPTDGRPFYGGPGNNKLNPGFGGSVYLLDNTREGHFLNLTTQLRKTFDSGLSTILSYNFLDAQSAVDFPEARTDRQLLSQYGARMSLMWQENPVGNRPNNPGGGFSEFGNRHRFLAAATHSHTWSKSFTTHVGLFVQMANGGVSTTSTRSRFSYTYAGDVNGDGSDSNDLLYIPRSANEINFAPILDENGDVLMTPQQQWTRFEAFIGQDEYLSSHRGKIAERNGGINPWFSTIDLRILQDLAIDMGGQTHTFQLSLDILNFGNMLNSSWGVRRVVDPAARSPLVFTGQYTANGDPLLQFPANVTDTFIDDAGVESRWQAQLGLRYMFN